MPAFSPPGSQSLRTALTSVYSNLQKLRDRQLAAPAESATIQELVKNELATKKHVATEGLLWLVRYVPLTGPNSTPN